MDPKRHTSLHERPIFLITSGRSGSTWLQKIINAHKDIVMWGEHAGLLLELERSYSAVVGQSQILDHAKDNVDAEIFAKKAQGQKFNPVWINPFTRDELREMYKDFVISLFARTINKNMRWGFKEIRYAHSTVLQFLHDLFPNAQFVFLERSIVDVCKSQMINFHGRDVINALTVDEQKIMINDILHSTHEQRGEILKFKKAIGQDHNVFFDIEYENLVKDYHAVVYALFEFLELDQKNVDPKTVALLKKIVVHPTKKDENISKLVNEMAHKKTEVINEQNRQVVYSKKLELTLNKVRRSCRQKDLKIKHMRTTISDLKQRQQKYKKLLQISALWHRSVNERGLYKKLVLPIKLMKIIFQKR